MRGGANRSPASSITGFGRSRPLEAAQAAQRLARLGIPARILRAQLVPGPAAAERARAARYALLLDACREAGCADLVLAHHGADQAETVRMRQDAGSGVAGLAGMAAISYRNEARLLRPLLAVAPARLRATLLEAGVAWAEDPTNQDLRTQRARLRAGMDGASTAAARHIASCCGAERRALERQIAAELGEVRFHPEGYAVVSKELSGAALSALLWTISGRAHPPPRAALEPALGSRTVHGVLIRPAGRLGPGTLVTREPGAVAPPQPARAGLFWDGRFRLGAAPPGLELGALGGDAAGFRRDFGAAFSGAAQPAGVAARERDLRRAASALSRSANVP